MLAEKKQRVIEEYVSGSPLDNILVRCKTKYVETYIVLKEYHDLKGLFFLEEYDCWIFPRPLEIIS